MHIKIPSSSLFCLLHWHKNLFLHFYQSDACLPVFLLFCLIVACLSSCHNAWMSFQLHVWQHACLPLPFCLPVCLPVCLSAFLSFCFLALFSFACLPVRLHECLSNCMFNSTPACFSACLSACLCLPACPPVILLACCLPIHISVRLDVIAYNVFNFTGIFIPFWFLHFLVTHFMQPSSTLLFVCLSCCVSGCTALCLYDCLSFCVSGCAAVCL